MIRLLHHHRLVAREFRINLTNILGGKGLDHQDVRPTPLVMSFTATAPQAKKSEGNFVSNPCLSSFTMMSFILRPLFPASLAIAAFTILLAGCVTAPTSPKSHSISPDNVRPTDKPPFFSFIKDMVPWGPSKTFKDTQRSFKKLCEKDELVTRETASDAVDLLDHALSQKDIKSNERIALENQRALAQDAFRFYELVANSWQRFGPGIQTNDPYKNEAVLKDYLEALQQATPSFARPGYQSALHKQSTQVERQFNEIVSRIRALEQEYSYSLTEARFTFIQQSARDDISFARNAFSRGKRPWYWVDNDDVIAEGLRPLVRVQECPKVHVSLIQEAIAEDQLIRSELSEKEIRRELNKTKLQPYDQQINYPGNSERAMRDWVRAQWDRKANDLIK